MSAKAPYLPDVEMGELGSLDATAFWDPPPRTNRTEEVEDASAST